jgi:hypothetical protein
MPRKQWSHIRDAKLPPEARERAARLTEAMLEPMALDDLRRHGNVTDVDSQMQQGQMRTGGGSSSMEDNTAGSMGRDPYVCVPVDLVDRALTRLSWILGDARALMEGDPNMAPSTHGAKIHNMAKSLLIDFKAMRARADRNAARGRRSASHRQRNADESIR